jgi:hypothetical protein
MQKIVKSILAGIPLALSTFSSLAMASQIPIGYVSWDVTEPGSGGQFDIVNQTGPNASALPDTSFPVTTSVHLSNLDLKVHFSDGSTEDFNSSYFTLSLDGISFIGSIIPIGGTNPQPTSATLTGVFSPLTISLSDGSTHSILAPFSSTILSSNGGNLEDGDLAIINANTTTPPVPEPASGFLTITGAVALGLLRSRRRQNGNTAKRSLPKINATAIMLLLMACVIGQQQAAWAVVPTAPVHLNTWSSPDSGVAGIDFVNVTGSGFPSASISPGAVNIVLSSSCKGATVATTTASSVKKVLGSNRRINFALPGTLAQGTYFISLSGVASDSTPFAASDCSEINVKHTNATLSACLPSSSLGVLAPSKSGPVTAYVPNGCWACGGTGLQVVPLEGGGAPVSVTTSGVVNSCSSNPATGQTVCVANNNDVYLLSGSTLNTTLTSGSNVFASFSGGSCKNCGVAINALKNQALISMGVSGPSNSGLQLLDLNTNVFSSPVPASNIVSENPSIDPTRGLVLSPGESGIYDLFQLAPTGAISGEFGKTFGATGEPDSAAEDCSTGVALSTLEFTLDLHITDLTQASFTAGSPGTWTAPGQIQHFPEFGGMGAGTSGISIAPGTAHLGIVAGEFGSNRIGVIQLPATSGSGTPGVVDYVATNLTPSFSLGLDPHTLTAYTSPNDGKAYGVLANSPAPTTLAVADLACILNSPARVGHNLAPTDAASCIRYIATH